MSESVSDAFDDIAAILLKLKVIKKRCPNKFL